MYIEALSVLNKIVLHLYMLLLLLLLGYRIRFILLYVLQYL